MPSPLLKVDHLKVYFPILGGVFRHKIGEVKAVDDVSFEIHKGQTVGLVGESGSGKTTIGRAIIRLTQPTSGSITYEDTDITKLSASEFRPWRKKIQIIFQDPYNSLNPRLSIFEIIGEALEIHFPKMTRADRRERVAVLLEKVGLKRDHLDRYPHEFSGGQRQRIGIARALAVDPQFIVCDEPVSALDASNRNRILALLRELRDALGIAIVIISHDLASIAGVVDRVAVLYRGRIVEEGDAAEVFRSPAHPYSALLLASAPRVSRSRWRFDLDPRQLQRESSDESDGGPDGGCVFAPRCRFAIERCRAEQPEPVAYGVGRSVGCHRASEWRAVLEGEAAR